MDKSSQLIQGCSESQGRPETTVRTVNSPLFKGSTILFDSYRDMLLHRRGEFHGISYGTDRLPNQREFEASLCQLEGGYLTRTFQSGISAIVHTLMAYTRQGDHILICDNVYGPTARFAEKFLSRYGITTDFLPPQAGADMADQITEKTRLIFLESPGSNTFEIQDIPAVTALARERGIPTVLDNTWATPLYLNPFDLGVDVSIQSVTKYISGHSDVLLGTATANEKWAAPLEEHYGILEIFAPSEECALALRGLKTLKLRLKQHETSALKVARWLEKTDQVKEVIHPALASHPQSWIWSRAWHGLRAERKNTMGKKPLKFIDETIREGMQHRGIVFSRTQKETILDFQEALGVDICQAGYPPAHPSEEDHVRALNLRAAKRGYRIRVAAMGRALNRDITKLISTGIKDFHLHAHPGKETSEEAQNHALEAIITAAASVRKGCFGATISLAVLDIGKTPRNLLESLVKKLIQNPAPEILSLPDTSGIPGPWHAPEVR